MTVEEFDKILELNIPVVMFMHAEWCAPCKAMIPSIEEITKEYDGKCKILDIDVEDSSELATKFKVRNVPTLLFLKNGEVVDKLVGSATKSNICSKINNILE